MDIGAQQALFNVLPNAGMAHAMSRRPAEETPKTQAGEQPSETPNGVARAESGQPDQNAVSTEEAQAQARALARRDREAHARQQTAIASDGESARPADESSPDGASRAAGGEGPTNTATANAAPRHGPVGTQAAALTAEARNEQLRKVFTGAETTESSAAIDTYA